MTDVEEIAVRALARSDALRLPIRDWSGHTAANRTIGLPRLTEFGVPLRVGGDAATRKAGERVLQDAVDAGLVVRGVAGRSKAAVVRLTDRGNAVARALAGCPGRGGGLWALYEVAKRSKREPKTLDELWVDEIALNAGKGWGERATREERAALAETEMNAVPALAEGWLVTDSTVRGHVRYAVALPGWAELDAPSESPDVGELPGADPAAEGLYGTELNAALGELQRAKPESVGEVGIPSLPVSHVGWPVNRPFTNSAFALAERAAELNRRRRNR